MIFALLAVVAPVFIVIGSGYLSAKLHYFKTDYIDGLTLFTQGFAIPVLLFRAAYSLNLSQSFNKGMLLSFYLGALASFILGTVIARYIFKNSPGESVVIGFGAMFSNSVLLGLSITEQAYGVEALANNYVIVSLHAPFCYLVGISTMEWARADGRGFFETVKIVVKAMFRNSIMIGIGLGFLFNLLKVPLPSWFLAAVDLIANAALPVALFALGGILTRYRIQDRIGEALVVVCISLLIHPLMTFVLSTRVFHIDIGQLRSAVLTAAMAPGINAYIFASMYKRAEGVAANAVLLGTLLCIFTVTMWLAIIGL